MVIAQDVCKFVSAPMEFFEFDVENGVQEFQLVQQVFRLLAPLVKRSIAS